MMFEEILALTDGPVKYGKSGNGHIKMENHYNPWSIKQDEFYYLQRTIIDNNLRAGYEVATAFGISALAASLAFKQTGGKLLTMDAYIEEQFNNSWEYRFVPPNVYENSDGYKSVMYLREKFEVTNHLEVRVGWSPTDTGRHIEEVHGDTKIDYVFVDGGHFFEQVLMDVQAVIPYLADRAFVFFHDVYDSTFTTEIRQKLTGWLGGDMQLAVPVPKGESLSYILTTR